MMSKPHRRLNPAHPGTDSNKLRRILHTMFGNLPIVEAKADTYLNIVTSDIDGATASPWNCVIARCLKRTLGARAALVLSGVAYVDMFDPRTRKRVIMRFVVTRMMHNLIKAFDKALTKTGKRVFPTEPVILRAPSRSQTVAACVARRAAYSTPQYQAAKARREAKYGKVHRRERAFDKAYTFRIGQVQQAGGFAAA